jgi:DNA-binding transcriptional regulator YhcF (GntR family)
VTVVDASADHVEASLDAGPTPLDLIVFGPIRSVNIFEETLERVAYTIKSGIYPPGTRLPSERELAARLEVSRATLREVNRALEQAGYVELRRGRTGGAFVLERPIEASREQARRVAREMAISCQQRSTTGGPSSRPRRRSRRYAPTIAGSASWRSATQSALRSADGLTGERTFVSMAKSPCWPGPRPSPLR